MTCGSAEAMLMTPRSLARSPRAGQHLGDQREVDGLVDAEAGAEDHRGEQRAGPGLPDAEHQHAGADEHARPDHEHLAPTDRGRSSGPRRPWSRRSCRRRSAPGRRASRSPRRR